MIARKDKIKSPYEHLKNNVISRYVGTSGKSKYCKRADIVAGPALDHHCIESPTFSIRSVDSTERNVRHPYTESALGVTTVLGSEPPLGFRGLGRMTKVANSNAIAIAELEIHAARLRMD